MFDDTIDLYPTPEKLAVKMIKSLSFKETHGFLLLPECVLEPSAGTGALAAALKKASYNSIDLDCIEIAASCRAILKDKGFRVIHDDFLSFEPLKHYDAIIMNPPFSCGATHLLRAIKIMENGGKICCLLNAETIDNPYSAERKELAKKIKEYGAAVEYFEDAFKDAERSTNVRIAMVVFDIPKKPPVSKIRLELEKGKEEHMSDPKFRALMSSDPISAAIEQYKMAATGLRRIYEEYNGIRDLLASPTNPEDKAFSLSKSFNNALRDLRMKYWKALFDIPAIRDRLTETMRSEYAERISSLAEYDFSRYNILTIREEIARNTVDGIESEILTLFDSLTRLNYAEFSGNIHYYNGWKTNSAYKIGKKIIFPCNAFCTYFNYNYEPTSLDVIRKLSNIELTLHFLDSNGADYDSSELREILKKAGEEKKTRNIQFHYFTVTFYKKGTCHLVFTNMDVLKSFNYFASKKKSWLPPSYGKCNYQNMPEEERHVVDSFEGEASYTDSMSRGLLLTSESFFALPM